MMRYEPTPHQLINMSRKLYSLAHATGKPFESKLFQELSILVDTHIPADSNDEHMKEKYKSYVYKHSTLVKIAFEAHFGKTKDLKINIPSCQYKDL